jgi:hypothetical protein
MCICICQLLRVPKTTAVGQQGEGPAPAGQHTQAIHRNAAAGHVGYSSSAGVRGGSAQQHHQQAVHEVVSG